MTDKQITERLKTDLDFERTKRKTLQAELQAKEQECEELKIYIESNEQQVKEVETLVMDNDRLINELDQLNFDYAELEKRHNDSFEQFKQLKAENKHLNDLLNQALKELEAIQDAYEERE